MENEKRMIDANPLCEFFQERYEYLRNASETQLPNGNVSIDLDLQVGAIITKEFLDKAKQAPTVDAVEVVRCKDCIHWCDCKVKLADGTYRDYLPGEAFGDVTLDNGINVSSHCTLHGYEDSSGSWFWARPNDFCSRGERRKDA